MDIVESLSADHGYLTTLARRIADELPRYVRARPQAVRRLRALVASYIDYERAVHQPRETCLRAYLAARADDHPGDAARPDDWARIRERLARPTGGDDRLDLRRRLAAVLRDSQSVMQREEGQLFVYARERLSETERHALALRAAARIGPMQV